MALACAAFIPGHWAPIRVMTPSSACAPCAPMVSRPTSRRTLLAAAAPWTDGPPVGLGISRVRGCANGLKEIFGWIKTVGGFRKTRYRGLERVDFAGYLVAAAYNLVRLARLAPVPTL